MHRGKICLWYNEISIVQGSIVEVDKNVSFAKLGYGHVLAEFQALKSIRSLDTPLACHSRGHSLLL